MDQYTSDFFQNVFDVLEDQNLIYHVFIVILIVIVEIYTQNHVPDLHNEPIHRYHDLYFSNFLLTIKFYLSKKFDSSLEIL